MKYRSIFILTTFIVLLSINKYSLHQDIKNQNDDISVVNISGRQRMYSQKITKIALLFKEDSTEEIAIKNIIQLNEVTANFKKAHQNLKKNHLTKYDDFYLNDLFNELEPYYLEIETKSKLIANNKVYKKRLNKYKLSLTNASDKFLPIMNNIVNQYELIGKNRGQLILKRELTFNIIIGLLSIYGVLFIIVPLINLRENK